MSEHERSVAIGMLKADVRVSDVARYHNCHLLTIQRLRVSGAVKDRGKFGQPRMATGGVKRQLMSIVYRRYEGHPISSDNGLISQKPLL